MRVDIGGIEEVNTSEVVKAYLEKTMPIPLLNSVAGYAIPSPARRHGRPGKGEVH